MQSDSSISLVKMPQTQEKVQMAESEFSSMIQELSFVSIPGGYFKMGSNNGYSDEKPIHTVSVKAFHIMDHEMTLGELKKLLQSYPRLINRNIEGDLKSDIGRANVTNVIPVTLTWAEARVVAEKLGEVTRRSVRLPTEAEWEYAARGGLSGKDFPWGNARDLVNGQQVSAIEKKITSDCPFGMPVQAVKSLSPPNGYKLYDIAGHVWEWTSSLYKRYPYSASDGREDASTRNQFRVIRGGGHAQEACTVRVALRGYGGQDSRYGVRYVMEK